MKRELSRFSQRRCWEIVVNIHVFWEVTMCQWVSFATFQNCCEDSRLLESDDVSVSVFRDVSKLLWRFASSGKWRCVSECLSRRFEIVVKIHVFWKVTMCQWVSFATFRNCCEDSRLLESDDVSVSVFRDVSKLLWRFMSSGKWLCVSECLSRRFEES